MEENNISLFVPNSLLNNGNISEYGLLVYCVLQKLSFREGDEICVTLQQIIFSIIGLVPERRSRIYENIIQGLEELEGENIIKIDDVIQKHYILDVSRMTIDTSKGNFTIIYFNEIMKIFEIDGVNNFVLLKYFVHLVGTISSSIEVVLPSGMSKNRVVGNYTIEYLSKTSGISTRAIIDYNKLLESNELIYVYRHDDFLLFNGEIRQLSNVYGRFSDSEYIDAYGLRLSQMERGYKKTNTDADVNKKRRLAQIYTQIYKHHKTNYTKEQILEVYNYVLKENERYQKLYDDSKFDNYLDKIRDVEIFKEFDFLKEIFDKLWEL